MKKTTISLLTAVTLFSVSVAHAQKVRDTATKQTNLEEVVVVGYTSKPKKELTNAISKVPDKVLESASRSNVATALQGTVAGVKVTQTTGQPGSTPSIQVRGGTDWGGSGSPLILIDGVPGSFYGLNSEDIESINVMKDAAATAVYGARGANGVVIVTTKRGKNGKSNINFNAKTSFNFKREGAMEYMEAGDYIKYNRIAIKNYKDQGFGNNFDNWLTGVYPQGTGNNTTNSLYTTMFLTDANRYLLNFPGWKTIDDPINPGKEIIYQDNKFSELFYQPSSTQDYTVSFDGGNDKASFYTSLGYMDDMGIVFGSRFKRISGVLNGSYKIRDNFKVSANVNYIRSNFIPNYLNDIYNVFQRAAGYPPTSRIYVNNPDGSLSSTLIPGIDANFGNPLYYNDKFYRNNLETRLNTSMQFDWAFLPKFNFMVRGSHFNVNNSDEYFAKAYMNGVNPVTTRNASYSSNTIMRNQVTAIVSYKNTYNAMHNVEALVGSEYFKENTFSSSASTKNSPTDLIYTLNAGSEANGKPGTFKSSYAIGSLFSQIHYDYDNRYLLDVNFRADGTSRLATDNRFDYFPGVAVGWNIHRENFFAPAAKYFNLLKPRISYGVNGNIEVLSNYGVYGIYSSTSIYDSQNGYVNTVLPNLPLLWERSATLNFGLDMGMLKNRITVAADYYIKDVSNKISPLVLPLWTGFSSIQQNNGTMQIKGFEFDITGKIINTDKVVWNLGANYTTFKSYAKSLPVSALANNRQGGTQIYDPATGTVIYVGGLEEGQRVGYDIVTAYVFDGVYKTQAEIDADKDLVVSFARKQTQRFLGDSKWKDINGDRIIDYKDRVVLGRTTPKFSGGFFSDLTVGNFNLYAKTDFAVGHLAINGRRVKGMSQTQGMQNGPVEVTGAWSPDNPTSDIPRYVFTDPQKNHLANGFDQGDNVNSSSRYWEKGDYLALREVTLSYTLPGSFVNDIVKNLRINVTGTNLAYFTDFSGSTPEAGGSNQGSFPVPRTVTVGLNATF